MTSTSWLKVVIFHDACGKVINVFENWGTSLCRGGNRILNFGSICGVGKIFPYLCFRNQTTNIMQKIVKIICESDAYDIQRQIYLIQCVEEAINRLQELPKRCTTCLFFGWWLYLWQSEILRFPTDRGRERGGRRRKERKKRNGIRSAVVTIFLKRYLTSLKIKTG